MAAEKRQLTAVQKGKRGAVIGFIAVELIMILVQASVGASMSDILAGMCMGPAGLLYGFGYVFGWQWTLRWAAGALHYSGHVLDAGFIWWICTGRKGGILRGLWFSLLLISFAVGLAWIPGVVKGIKEIRAEKKNRAVSETDYAVKREKRKKLRKEEPVPVVQSQPVVEKQQPTVLETPKVAANACYVDCYGGEFNGASFDMREILQLAIGRNPELCRVVLNQSGISRIHCLLQYRADGIYVQDLSTNGTYLLNGARLPKGTFVYVKPGDGVRLGQNGPEFRFR